MLRFANPGSDIDKLVRTFAHIASVAGDDEYDLDFMVDAAGNGGLVSSVGAVGAEAIRRSRRPDRSRDPMYNQLKMYSEIWRMLGLLRAGEKRLLFRTTPLGSLVADAQVPYHAEDKALLRELFLGIAFPSPQTENKGIENLRPFSQLLLLMSELDGRISRDEMIIGLYVMADDQTPNALADAVARVNAVRGDYAAMRRALEATCQTDGIQVNTAQNYTRIPIGVLMDTSIGWAGESTEKTTYGRSVKFFNLKQSGRETVERLRGAVDVRWCDISEYLPEHRAAFLNVAHYAMLERAGFETMPGQPEFLAYAESVAAPVLDGLGVVSRQSLLFSPFQQAPNSDTLMADGFESRWYANPA